jgi:hypothetical protein
MAGFLGTDDRHYPGDSRITEADAVRLYSEATRVDEFEGTYPPLDTGSSGVAVCRAAKAERLIGSYRHAFGSTRDVLLWMVNHGPVLLGISWYESFDEPGPDGLLRLGGQVRGGHEILARGVRAIPKLIKIDNSWSEGWGVRGSAYMPWAVLDRLRREQGDVTAPIRGGQSG